MEDPQSYRVVWSGHHRETVEFLSNKAAARGLESEFLKDLEHIIAQLTTTPSTWGDPYTNLRHLGLVMYRGLSGLLHIHYGVDEVRHLVFVKDILPFPGHGLD